MDIPALRVQLAGSYILEALRLHRAGKRRPGSEHLVSDSWDTLLHQWQPRDRSISYVPGAFHAASRRNCPATL